jgi:hypothetical protein
MLTFFNDDNDEAEKVAAEMRAAGWRESRLRSTISGGGPRSERIMRKQDGWLIDKLSSTKH